MFKTILLFLLSALSLQSLGQSPTPAEAKPAVITTERHKSAVELVEVMGLQKTLEDNFDKTTEKGKAALLQNYPSYDPAFADEWAKRMRIRVKIDDYLDVFIRVYENHFDNSELRELIQAQQDRKESKVPNISAQLKEKLTSSAITMQSEILGGCSQVGAKLGGEIGDEIGKEHPEWVKGSTSDAAKPH